MAERETEGLRQRQGGKSIEWRPRRSMGGWIVVSAAFVAVMCVIAAYAYALGRPIAIDSFVATVAALMGCALALLGIVLAYGYFSMRYRLGSRELTVEWLWTREVVPLGSVDGLYRGHVLGKKVDVEGITWPGHYVGVAEIQELGRVKYYGTTLQTSQTLVVTAGGSAYALTPADLEGFRNGLIQRLESLPEETGDAPEPKVVMPRLLQLSMLRDGVSLALLGVALLVLLGSFGYLAARYPHLPELMPLHFNYAGEPDIIGPPRDAFWMPLMAAVALGLNTIVAAALHGWQRDAARLLAAATLFVELAMLVAVVKVVH